MISRQNRLINQLLGTITHDKHDPSVIRINIDNTVNILSGFGYNLPTIFEQKLTALLDKKMVGTKLSGATKYGVAQLIIKLADSLHIDEHEIMKYIMAHNTEQDVKEIQEKIKSWRKEYYGSLGKREKQALLDALSSRLRPDVLEDIKNA